MTAGRPDYTSQALIKGADSGTHRTVAVDASGNMLTLIKGSYAGSPLTVAVDSAGHIVAVLQGEYSGSLQTIQLDSQGRLLAVLTDPEDVYGNAHYMGQAELAARLGSPMIFDRRGQAVFMDAGGTNKWLYDSDTIGTESDFYESGVEGLLTPLSYYLKAGPNEGNSAQFRKSVPRVTTGKAGLEWTIVLDPQASQLDVVFEPRDGSYRYRGGIRANTDDDKLYYWSSAGAWVELQAMPYMVDTIVPHNFKLVVDEGTQKYVRLLVDRTSIDLSSYGLQKVAALGGPYHYCEWTLYAGAAGSVHNHIGGIIVTVNEE